MVTPCQCLGHHRRGRRHQRTMEGRANRKENRRAARHAPWRSRPPVLPPPCCRRRRPALPRCRWPLRRPRPPPRRRRSRVAASRSRPRSAAIAPTPTGTASCMARPRMRRSRAASDDAEAACSGERRIFAERMAGDIGDAVHADALRREHARCREAHRHQRRLGVLGQGQRLDRAFEDDRRQLFAEGGVDLIEDGARLRVSRRRARAPSRPPGCPGREM